MKKESKVKYTEYIVYLQHFKKIKQDYYPEFGEKN